MTTQQDIEDAALFRGLARHFTIANLFYEKSESNRINSATATFKSSAICDRNALHNLRLIARSIIDVGNDVHGITDNSSSSD